MRAAMIGCILILAATPAAAAEPKTAAAVKAVDDAWGDAEAKGDAGFVARLLLPGYRSIGGAGKTTTREDIVTHTTKQRAPDYAKKVADWKRQHPSRADVTLFGDAAVVTWASTAPATTVYSSDIFVYRDGHWRAIYSQHSNAAG
jgi:Tfp pilus assembly protein PilW